MFLGILLNFLNQLTSHLNPFEKSIPSIFNSFEFFVYFQTLLGRLFSQKRR